jgi:hypothetical protein
MYIGIDPGKRGGIAWTSGKTQGVYLMPETTLAAYGLLVGIATGIKPTVIIEQVQVMGKAFGAKAALSYGQGYGELIGIATALGLKIVEVRPSTWKKAMKLSSDKNESIALCERLFPEVILLPTPRCTKPSDGMAEALLLAEYGRRLNL